MAKPITKVIVSKERKLKPAFEIRDLKLKEAEYHYRFALKLRKNFPLAALNLGALQYVELNQLAEALASFERCGFQMDPSRAKSFHQHVSTQVECLISGSRLLLASSGPPLLTCMENTGSVGGGGNGKGARRGEIHSEESIAMKKKEEEEEVMTKQTLVRKQDDVTAAGERFTRTTAATNDDDDGDDGHEGQPPLNCSTLLKWTDTAKAKANQVVVSWANVVPQDPNKQLAEIHWIRAHCICGKRKKKSSRGESKHLMVGPQEDKRSNELRLAFEYAKRSKVSIESSIYISCVDDLLLEHKSTNQIVADQLSNTLPDFGEAQESVKAEQVLKEAIYVERQKLSFASTKFNGANANTNNNDIVARNREQIGKLYLRLAKLVIAKSNIKQMEEILTLSGHFGATNFNLLSEAAQLSYEWKQFERSEKLYLTALELVKREEVGARNGRKLATAHANVGAIAQVRGKLEEASDYYRRALDYNPNNRIAATNLARLEQQRVAKSRRK